MDTTEQNKKGRFKYGVIVDGSINMGFHTIPFRVRATPPPSKDNPLICSVCGLDTATECNCEWNGENWVKGVKDGQ